jgi:hypothetical protein
MRASDASKLREDVKNIALDAKARAQFLRKEKSMTIKATLSPSTVVSHRLALNTAQPPENCSTVPQKGLCC